MIKDLPKYTIISFFLAILLKRLTYSIGHFNFGNATLFSLYTLYDLIIFIIFFIILQYVITKIMSTKNQNKEKQ